VAHAGRQHAGVQEECRGSDEVVGVDSAVGTAVLACRLPGCTSDLLIDCDPRHGREELFEGRELVVSDAGEEFEPNDLAGGEGLVALDELPLTRRPCQEPALAVSAWFALAVAGPRARG
jgi:hypothetical protein